MGCSPTTVTRTCDRWHQAGPDERESGRWCAPRPPVPKSCPCALSGDDEQQVLTAREKTIWGPMRLAAVVGRHRSMIWKVLKRHNQSRRRRGDRRTFRRFRLGAARRALHIHAYSAPKFPHAGAPRHRRARQAQGAPTGWARRW